MNKRAIDRDPSEFDGEDCLHKDSFLPHLLTVANNGYAWHASRLYVEVLGIGVNEVRIISILYEFGKLQAWEICNILRMNKATVSQAMQRLEKERLIEFETSRQGRLAKPTARSRPIHRQIVRMARSREEVMLEGFKPEERRKFREYLTRLIDNQQDTLEYTVRHFLPNPTDGAEKARRKSPNR